MLPAELTSSLPYSLLVIVEELLVEKNIQAEESVFSTVTLFGGFLALLVLKLLEPN